jgi:hypothetical protein
MVGFGLTTLGLVYTIVQIRKTKSAAKAAAEAADKVLLENTRNFLKYSAIFAHRFINEAKNHIHKGEWEQADKRISDLAVHSAQLAINDAIWKGFTEQIRIWASTCNRMASGKLKRFPQSKWVEFIIKIEAKIDELIGPFIVQNQEARNDN